MDITTRDIGYFLSVVQAGSLTIASRHCHVTEAALSKSISRVEAAVGISLFDRKKKGMVLTQAGAVIHAHAVRIRREHDDAMTHAADLRSGIAGHLRVGVTRPVFDGFLSSAIARLVRQQPRLDLRVFLDISSSLTAMLELGQLDLVFAPLVGTPRRDLEVIRFGYEELAVVARARHPLFRKRTRNMPDLLQYAWIIPPRNTAAASWLEERFVTAGLVPPKACVEIDYAGDAALDLVAASDLLLLSPGPWPSRANRRAIRRVAIAELEFKRPIYTIARRGCYWSLGMKALVDSLSVK